MSCFKSHLHKYSSHLSSEKLLFTAKGGCYRKTTSHNADDNKDHGEPNYNGYVYNTPLVWGPSWKEQEDKKFAVRYCVVLHMTVKLHP